MGKDYNQQGHGHGVLASHENKTNFQWNVPVPAGGASYKDDWHNPMQNLEYLGSNRKEGPKRVTWDELVHVRTIEPCPGQGRGKWHNQRHQHEYGHQPSLGQWDQTRLNSFHSSVTSPIYDL
jgi:hypothetical protein